MHTILIVAATTFLLGFSSCKVIPCQRPCKCIEYTSGAVAEVRVDCTLPGGTKGSIKHVPYNFSPNTTQILLDNHEIELLTSSVFHYYPKLRHLSLKGNSITRIENGAFGGLRELRDLDLSSNLIATIESEVFKDTPVLENLNLANNRLNAIPKFWKLDKIQSFDIALNNITDCTLPAEVISPYLRSVTLSGNQCTQLSKSTFENLINTTVTKLEMSNCRVKMIEPDSFKGLIQLDDLDLAGSRLLNWTIIGNVEFPSKLTTLWLDSINSSGSSLPESVIENLPDSLQVVHMKQCDFHGKMPSFRHLNKLKYLYVNLNKFTALPDLDKDGNSGFPYSIEHLALRSNSFEEVADSAFAGLNRLESVDLSFCSNIKSFSSRAFGSYAPNMTDLQLESALQDSKYPKGLLQTVPNLQRLVMSENQLEDFPTDIKDDFDKLKKLHKLDLTGNKFRTLPHGFFKELGSVRELLLDDNYLGEALAHDEDGRFFQGLDSLSNLNLEENHITSLPHDIFSRVNVKDFRRVDLLGNLLTKVPKEAIAPLKNLTTLNLDANEIQVFSPNDFIDFPLDSTIDMWANPVECTCVNYDFFK